MKLFKIKHIRDKAILKGRRLQKALDDKLIDVLKKDHENMVTKLQADHERALSLIRKQEKNFFEPLVKQLNEEIARLQQNIIDNKVYYSAILDYGLVMEETGAQASDLFRRAQLKIIEADKHLRVIVSDHMKSAENIYAEAMQLIDMGKSKIENTQNLIEKEKPKLIRSLK